MNKNDFGESFEWGVTTAAYQIEGAHNIDGKGPSIWDKFVLKKENIKSEINNHQSCDHYNRYKEDVANIKKMNFGNYRFSLSWARLIPEGTGILNPKGFDFYDRLIDQCLEQGITPWATLYHWDLPQALQDKGGWTNRDILGWFSEYTDQCTKKLGDRINNWIVLNEPMVFTGAGYFLGYHAPGKRGLVNFLPAMHHATMAQGIGGRIIRDNVAKAKIGTTYSCSYIEPINYKPKNVAAARRFNALLNRLYLEPVLGLGYPIEELKSLRKIEKHIHQGDMESLPFDFDFIGLQNYTREIVEHKWYMPYVHGKIIPAKQRNKPATTMGWEVYPESIYHMLLQFNSYKGIKEIIVTESGAAFNDKVINGKVYDQERKNYFKHVLYQLLQAKNEGVNVTGYFVWSLLDNFEWAEGFSQRFGLVHTNFNTQERIIKNSGLWFKEFLK